MNCASPPELDDRQLLEAIDGAADPQVAAHLEQCPSCRARAGELAALQKSLTARLYRLSCPSSLELGDYHFGLLPKLQAAAVSAHLRECPHCTLEIAQLQSYLGDPVLSSPESPLERFKVLIARLVGGPEEGRSYPAGSLAPAFAALRGGAKGPITLEADGILILLDVQPGAGGGAAVLGQVSAEDQDAWTGALVELSQAGRTSLTASVDDLGAFRFEGVLPGPTGLRITPEAGPVVTANIEILL